MGGLPDGWILASVALLLTSRRTCRAGPKVSGSERLQQVRLPRRRCADCSCTVGSSSRRCAARILKQQVASGAGHHLDAVYLRTAQAYMLISMPTGTSTIFGVFQAIRVSRVLWRDVSAE